MKIRKLLLACLLAFVSSMTMNAQRVLNTGRYDVNKDGEVTITDVTLLVNAILGRTNYPIQKIVLPDKMLVAVGESEAMPLKPLITPADADFLTLLWTSSNENIAKVDQTGKVTGVSEGTCTITATAMDGSDVMATCTVKVVKCLYVDLGLPSGTLWAICNIGAFLPEDYGDYFAWGETMGYNDGKAMFNWNTYQYSKGSLYDLTKYCYYNVFGIDNFTDTLKELENHDDAAYVNWGANWRMPTYDQQTELCEKCEWTWNSEKKGYDVVGPNGNSIFMPAAGYRDEGAHNMAGSHGFYWSRTVGAEKTYNACYLFFFGNEYVNGSETNRYRGQSVRPVRASGN